MSVPFNKRIFLSKDMVYSFVEKKIIFRHFSFGKPSFPRLIGLFFYLSPPSGHVLALYLIKNLISLLNIGCQIYHDFSLNIVIAPLPKEVWGPDCQSAGFSAESSCLIPDISMISFEKYKKIKEDR